MRGRREASVFLCGHAAAHDAVHGLERTKRRVIRARLSSAQRTSGISAGVSILDSSETPGVHCTGLGCLSPMQLAEQMTVQRQSELAKTSKAECQSLRLKSKYRMGKSLQTGGTKLSPMNCQ